MNKSIIISALLVAGASLTAPCGFSATTPSNAPAATLAASKPVDLFPDSVVAKGKGLEVKRSQLDEAMINIRSSAAAHNQTLPPEQVSMIEQQVLQRLIQVQLLMDRATEADKAAGQQAATIRYDALRTNATSAEMFTRQLKAIGTTPEELRKKMVQESTAEAVLERELKINVPDADVKKFYDDNPSKFEQPEMVRASHILLKTRDDSGELSEDKKAAKHKQAEDLLKRARAGEDFAKLAQENSEDPGSKDKGGEYTFPRGQMVPEFEAAAFSLKTNEVSDIVTTQFGYHIIKLGEKIPAHKVEFAKVESNIREYLKQQQIKERQTEVQGYLDKLQKDADVAILDDSLKPSPASASGLPSGHPAIAPGKPPEKN